MRFVLQHNVQSATAFATEMTKTCCLDKLASERGKACAAKPVFAVLSLVLAQRGSLPTGNAACNQNCASQECQNLLISPTET